MLKYIFGPVPSRRLGRSLGINVVPSKVCSLDCIYCEVGRTKALTLDRKEYIKVQKILDEFNENKESFYNLYDVVTITGAGEPTLNIKLKEILHGLKALTDKPIALLTNTTTITDDDVFNTMLDFDIVIPSLDGVLQDDFTHINMPHHNIKLNNVIDRLIQFSNIYTGRLFLEILFCKGANDSPSHIEKLKDIIPQIKYAKVQLGTINRPPAYSDALPVSDEFLLKTANYFKENNINAEITGGFSTVYKNSSSLDFKDLIISLITMRPCTTDDIISVFGKTEEDSKQALKSLVEEGIAVKDIYDGKTYYYHYKLNLHSKR